MEGALQANQSATHQGIEKVPWPDLDFSPSHRLTEAGAGDSRKKEKSAISGIAADPGRGHFVGISSLYTVAFCEVLWIRPGAGDRS